MEMETKGKDSFISGYDCFVYANKTNTNIFEVKTYFENGQLVKKTKLKFLRLYKW